MPHPSYPQRTTEERLAAIETLLAELHTRLLGNGQPGDIDKMRAELKGDIYALQKRVGVLEKFKYTLMGAASAVGACVGACSAWLAHKIGV